MYYRLALFVVTVCKNSAVFVATLSFLKEMKNKYIYRETCLLVPRQCMHSRCPATADTAKHGNFLFKCNKNNSKNREEM